MNTTSVPLSLARPAAALAIASSLMAASCGGGGGDAAEPEPTRAAMPALTSPSAQSAAVGAAVEITIANTGGDVASCSAPSAGPAASRLPAGLAVGIADAGGTKTCAITGTVDSAAEPGTYIVAITAASAAGPATVNVTFTVPAPPILASPPAQAAAPGSVVDLAIANTGGDVTSCSAPTDGPATSRLPAGLSAGAADTGGSRTCVITGTLDSAASPGTYTVAITAASAAGPATVNVTFTVPAPPILASPPAQTVAPGSMVDLPIANTGGDAMSCNAPSTGAETSRLPAGLSVGVADTGGSRTCVITGTLDSAASPGTYTVAITAASAAGPATVNVTFTVPAPPILASPPAQTVAPGSMVDLPIANAGGDVTSCSAPSDGAETSQLPAGLSAGAADAGGSRTCVITGTLDSAASPGTHTVAITAASAAGPATVDVTFTVLPRTLPVERSALGYTPPPPGGQSGTLTLDWDADANADVYRVFRGLSDDPLEATELTDGTMDPIAATRFVDANAADGATYNYWVQSCRGSMCSGFGKPIPTLARIADVDGDGLIEIATVRQLHSVRHSLDGSRYRPEAGSAGSASGCPEVGCAGYELVADIDFDSDGDGSTWSRGDDGSVELDAGDHDSVHFDTEDSGWAPIGDCGADGICVDFSFTGIDEATDNRPFTATFDGNGHTIAGLATAGDHAAVGMFGFIGEGAEIRNLDLIGNLARHVGPSRAFVGGLVGWQVGGSITASHATGDADGGAADSDSVGGLVGRHVGGSITASHATGDADGGAGENDHVGSLVGHQVGGSITASYATGDADGGAGNYDYIGSLVGRQVGGSIAASWATGGADGGEGALDSVGGLVGHQVGGSITASHATGPADGGAGGGDYVGGLVGRQDGGSITASHATGGADGGEGALDSVGGLVGRQDGGSITASHATGDAVGGGGDSVGGLVGRNGGSITASYATGDADGGNVGGLVGYQGRSSFNSLITGSITASYATGDATGGESRGDSAGGLVGHQFVGSITASYSTGVADGGAGGFDYVGGLVGQPSFGSITASWGFGTATGETTGSAGSGDRPDGVTQARQLASANAPASWSQASSNTLGAWGFGTASQTPVLSYADYDGAAMGTAPDYTSGHIFHCAGDDAPTPNGAALIPGCAGAPALIPGQRDPMPVERAALSYTPPPPGGQGGTLTLDWGAAANVDGYRVFRGGDDPLEATELTDGTMDPIAATRFVDTNAVDGAAYRYWVQSCLGAMCSGFGKPISTVARIADADGDGLIEITTARELHNVRHSLDGSRYRHEAGAAGSIIGCPEAGCVGYELVADIDFDSDGDGTTWSRRDDGSVELDAGDRDSVYFDTEAGGWAPIGDCGGSCLSFSGNRPFTATFEGNGHTIAGLATVGDHAAVGMFGLIGVGAEIRNLGLTGNLARNVGSSGADVGGLVGRQNGGSITASHATGDADGGAGSQDRVGGLVGRQARGSITASRATGSADGGAGGYDSVGGLVGFQDGSGSITASYSTGPADGGAGERDRAGGLVGRQSGGSPFVSPATGSITASYATGDATGGAGNFDSAGGLVGHQFVGSITASYSTGLADGGADSGDYAGGLVGQPSFGSITASWGFGTSTGGTAGSAGSDDRPAGVTQARQLASANAPASWSQASSNTLGAWGFGTASQTPALSYADYDGAARHIFHCAGGDAPPPDGAALIPGCADAPALIPGQRDPMPVERAALSYTPPPPGGQGGTLTLAWGAAANADGYRVFRGGSDDPLEAAELTDGQGPPIAATRFVDNSAAGGAAHHYWVQSCLGAVCSGFGEPISTLTLARAADADGDGLIEVATARELHSVRHSLDGSRYRPEAGSLGSIIGCPEAGCTGYELVADIDFDSDGDGSTWSRGGDGSAGLDAGDHDSVHFDTGDGGWAPIGDCGADGSCSRPADNRPFAATFEGNGHTIAGLATAGGHAAVGMFGLIGEGAEIRNLGLVGNLVRYVGLSSAEVGGLVGHQSGGSITASWAAGPADGGAGVDYVGGLVGRQYGGSITASYATGPADGGAGGFDYVGGLVGHQSGGSITASYATGPADGGAGGFDYVGGLVGHQYGGSITASYATGPADGGAGGFDYVGGLVGFQGGGSITASYATGPADGGAGGRDFAGALVGQTPGGSIAASWGFGTSTGGTAGNAGSDDRPAGVTQARQLASANAPASWSQASSNTLGAWGFGTASQTPALSYADYDGAARHIFHCAGGDAPPPDGAALIPGCADAPALIPGQRDPMPVERAALSYTPPPPGGQGGTLTLAWGAAANADGYRVFRGGSDDPLEAAELTDGQGPPIAATRFVDNSAAGGAAHHYWVQSCLGAVCSGFGEPISTLTLARAADADGDGLIEVATARELHSVRHSLDGSRYRPEAGSLGSIIGCPEAGCTGYELVADIDFDSDGDGSTWSRGGDGSAGLDAGDHDSVHFDTGDGGWAPIGDCGADGRCSRPADNRPFAATFEGNGHTIAGLATAGGHAAVGMFGLIGEGAEIRNLGLVGNLVRYVGLSSAEVGGLVGHQSGGSITASWAAGPADGGAGGDYVGGLVGRQYGGSITASHATGDADGGAGFSDAVGGLVGFQGGGSITASYATGGAEGGTGSGDFTGGLVGQQYGGSITASYATGGAEGGTGSGDFAGGLVGFQGGGSITASYATGPADGGAGGRDFAGALVGQTPGGSIAASWGFGTSTGGTAGNAGSDDRPAGVTQARQLASANAPASWSQASSNTLGAWGFGTASQTPALSYADYDGAARHIFHCAGGDAPPPDGAALIPGCADAPALIPGQRDPMPVERAALSYTPPPPGGQGGTLTLAWGAAANADGYRVFRGGSDDPLEAAELTDGQGPPIAATRFVDNSAAGGAAHHYWVQSCLGAVCSGFGEPISTLTLARAADADGDGLIEVATARELHSVRHSLDGSRYRPEAGSLGSIIGCPEAGCTGYELVADIDFDSDGDGSTWSRGGDGSAGLDAGDHDSVHFDTGDGGWAPIGDCGADGSCSSSFDNRPFTAIFDGGGHTIAGLATAGGHAAVGMFGLIGEGAEIRNLGLTGNLARHVGSSSARVGGLVGHQVGGSITASWATGPADGGAGVDYVGGLVGHQVGGSITASHATGDADGGAGGGDRVGGLVGRNGGSITASHATGDADGGAGGGDRVGGLVGRNGGSITASYATGPADGGAGDFDSVGGLVGEQGFNGSITASYATGPADGGAGDFDSVGGLVGHQVGGSITASYATGPADGGAGDFDSVGGLVGHQVGGSITASYATGPADGGATLGDHAGGLVGHQVGGSITASWGFGTAAGETAGPVGSDDRPDGVTQASQLASANAPAVWNQASSNTLGAWDFGTASQTPALSYADYDGAVMGTVPDYTGGHIFHCAGDAAPPPDGAALIPGCADAPAIIPGQRAPRAALSYTPPPPGGQGGTLTLDWGAVANADGYRVFRSGSDDPLEATELTDGTMDPIAATRFVDTNAEDGAAHHYWVLSCLGAVCSGFGEPISTLTLARAADADGDGLIEIATARELHSVRHSLDGSRYRPEAGSLGSIIGCPEAGCTGYELVADIDFDSDGDGSTWSRGDDGSVELDAGDRDSVHFDTEAAGWVPIGDCGADGFCSSSFDNRPFTAIFDGGGHTIAGLATAGGHAAVGMFGLIGEGAEIRNLGLTSNLARNAGSSGAPVGGLVGYQYGGSITASYATGPADGGAGSGDSVGGLVGYQYGGSITASHAAGDADGGAGGFNRVGGLVGYQYGGSITASHATGDADGGAGADNVGGLVGRQNVGGLVGQQDGGSITASHATGDASSGNNVGGLVGRQDGSITASYATGDASSVTFAGGLVGWKPGGSITASYATGDASSVSSAGGLVGFQNSDTNTASWGFGTATGGTPGPAGSGDRPVGVTQASQLASANVPDSWSQASSNTLEAWDFGTTSQTPALSYADYDGVAMGTAPNYTSGHRFHCADDDAPAPVGAVVIPGCADAPVLIPGQRTAQPVGQTAPGLAPAPAMGVQRGEPALAWAAARGEPGPRAASGAPASPPAPLAGAGGPGSVADADGDGLIEVATLRQLHNVRFGLAGASRRDRAGGPGSSLGCPGGGCFGYELVADLDFDADGDGSTWGGAPGSYALDPGDRDPVHFDTRAGGWAPLGASGEEPFDAVFEGNGHTISGLATIAASGPAGMFGHLSARARVRNLGLDGNLAARATAGPAGGIAARSRGRITASFATGPAHASGEGAGRAGGLVGRQDGGAIHSCFAAGPASVGDGAGSSAGGLAGAVHGGSVTASYATGAVAGPGAGGQGLGGLVGWMSGGSVTASWAGGAIDAGTGGGSRAGALVGSLTSGSVADSWGFGAVAGGGLPGAIDGSGARPGGAASAGRLTMGSGAGTDVPASWSDAAAGTLGAWDLGTASQAPALRYADYDGPAPPDGAGAPGGGGLFHCADAAARAPEGAEPVAGPCAEPGLIPRQRGRPVVPE